ncbi:MAG: sulfur carrier protein ThiS [Syntrophomonadaceae bacterium]|nr:sulfur carrier protein ThiS [Syntrophomonadaceae bacterium]
MLIKVNGKDLTLEKELSVKELIDVQRVEAPEYVTVQINEEFVDRNDFDSIIIKDGDIVEFLYFMGGGRI